MNQIFKKYKQQDDRTERKGKKHNRYLHPSPTRVLPGGKPLETEGLREASSVGPGSRPGSGYKG